MPQCFLISSGSVALEFLHGAFHCPGDCSDGRAGTCDICDNVQDGLRVKVHVTVKAAWGASNAKTCIPGRVLTRRLACWVWHLELSQGQGNAVQRFHKPRCCTVLDNFQMNLSSEVFYCIINSQRRTPVQQRLAQEEDVLVNAPF